jgi:hypothetical protein
MADPNTEDHADEMERDLHQLEDHITDAEKKLEARKGDADITGDVAGDWEGEQDRGGGDDPQGAAADERQGARADPRTDRVPRTPGRPTRAATTTATRTT